MIVEILQKHKHVDGDVGDQVEIDAEQGNWLSCIGVVRVIEHDSAAGKPGSQVIRPPEQETSTDDEEGIFYVEE